MQYGTGNGSRQASPSKAAASASDPELVWLAHEHEPWRPRTA
jgi:hypothetical protein